MPSPSESTPRHPEPEPAPAPEPIRVSRRYWLRAGAAAPTVLLSLASRPVFGGTCSSASAFGSLDGSATVRTAGICSGLTPEQWASGYGGPSASATSGTPWPAPFVARTGVGPAAARATQFHSPATGFSGDSFAPKTLLEVLEMPGGGMRDLAKHVAAALLNARAGRTPVLDETRVRQIWNDYVARRYFEPTAGVQWDIPQIVAYLRSTMG